MGTLEIQKTIITLPVMAVELKPRISREGHRLRGFETKAFGRIFGFKRK
jgi:hypothetical protein